MLKTLGSLICTLFLLSLSWAQTTPGRVTVSGYVRETNSQEALIGASVYVPGTSRGTTTNTYGFYSLTLSAQDSLPVVVSLMGYTAFSCSIPLHTDTTLHVQLAPGQALSVVEVKARRTEEKLSESAQMSQVSIPISQIKKVPAFLGEKDVLKVLQLMPGVQKGSEGQTGIYVRGGGPDQNLIILDDAVVYNASHLFGFFSVFNGDALKSVELTKGGFPARYGGRLSSVIELNMKDGNREKLHGEGGIGLIASRLVLEGPLTKNKKGSFLVSGRRTYLDLLTAPLVAMRTNNQTQVGYYFYDLNAKINYDLGPTNKLYVSGFMGRDRFYTGDQVNRTDIGLNWGNTTGTLRWNHLFNQKLFSNLSLIASSYALRISSDQKSLLLDTDLFYLRYNSAIRDFSLKYDVEFYPGPLHALRTGVQTIYHHFTPSALVMKNSVTTPVEQAADNVDALESAAYLEDVWRPTHRWRVNAGIRLSHFLHKKEIYRAIGPVRFEPRLSAAYTLMPDLSVKVSYALMNQYVHLLSNTGVGLPTDLWVPSTDRVKPQQSRQVAIGLAQDFTQQGLTLTLEGYYKTMGNIINYKEGVSFLLLNGSETGTRVRWEDNVTAGRGWSYGAEVLLQKKAGRFNGWVGYTLSWTQWQFDALNGGRWFYPRYDRRHDLSLVGIVELSKRMTLSGTWVYGTGNALTVPLGQYNTYQPGGGFPYDANGNLFRGLFQPTRSVEDYGTQKNSFRAEAYHRFDIGIQLHKQKKHHERTWEFSLYNAYNRRNPFFYQLESVNGGKNQPSQTVMVRYSIFPIIPAFSYSFTF
ncbi:TonB-dependent receptor [Spirosoma utsteinense]|uniref:Outer membrane receptor for ferrienterochelin and colicin n=1 Tax=Spirosoma utsteinense TaxID=2585773 RepID=A0ABR6W2N8_9BACT|nr:TonB-dependent receptor [Spirosoma utsteinense]MBC3784327.1 outer membrane receptor for ferrienterochelin and colicin [Spirosoma utsteinense]MBC3790874.1 outer membrane receptor for ferrienterochelin and colicin [Spirosoma utsteinense]